MEASALSDEGLSKISRSALSYPKAAEILKTKAMHARLEPLKHEFTYNLYTYCFDIDQLSEIGSRVKGFNHNSFGITSIFDKDYLSWGNESLRNKLDKYLLLQGFTIPIKRYFLVSSPRYFGYVFNPASFYFCYDHFDKLCYFITEINNTFSEKHIYVVEAGKPNTGGIFKAQLKKAFHVSPFFSQDYNYEFNFADIREKLDIRINLLKDKTVCFVSRFWGDGFELTTTSQFKMIARYPMRPLLTMPRIMWQALRLFGQRRLPVIPKPNPTSVETIRAEPCSWVDQACGHFLKKQASKIDRGKLVLSYPDNREEYFGDLSSAHSTRVKMNNFNIYKSVVFDGSIGFGESYVNGDWDTDDLTSVLKLFLNNAHVMEESKLNAWKPTRFINWLGHKFRGNTLLGSRKNISAHYDLSNELFQLFLDPTMMYSSALFKSGDETLQEAQENKLSGLLNKTGIQANEHLLEIGSGWGSLAISAAKDFGCKVTSLTLSTEQKKFAQEKAASVGVANQVDFALCDYRQAQGQFDAIVSVEMLEAVGHEHLESFFSSCERLLKPDGRVVIQFIAFPDCDYAHYRGRQDWIQKHIFPGSHLPSLSALLSAVTNSSRLMVDNVENIAASYAQTLKIWRENFNANADKVKELGFDEKFLRMWNFYLASCEAEFATRWLGLFQVVLTRPNNQRMIS